MPIQYSGDILVYVILALIGFLGVTVALIVWVVKTELRHIRTTLHDLRNTIQEGYSNFMLEIIRAMKEKQ